MKVRSKAVYEATQITTGMCGGKEELPTEVFRDPDSDMCHWTRDGVTWWFDRGDWFVPDFRTPRRADNEFREEFEEVGP